MSLQEELKKRALDAKWTPLKGKKELVDRLQVRGASAPFASLLLNRSALQHRILSLSLVHESSWPTHNL